MLSKKLSSGSSAKTILVGSAISQINASNVTGSNMQFPGIGIKAGDLIVFVLATYSASTPTATITTPGYTSIYSVASNNLRAQAFYKVSDGTEYIISYEPGGGAGVGQITGIVAVFRGFQYNSRLTSTFSGSGFPNPPSISCSVDDLILAIGHTDFGYSSVTVPSGYKLVKNAFATDGTNGTATQMFYKIAESTSEDPDAILIGYTSTWVAATIRCTPV